MHIASPLSAAPTAVVVASRTTNHGTKPKKSSRYQDPSICEHRPNIAAAAAMPASERAPA